MFDLSPSHLCRNWFFCESHWADLDSCLSSYSCSRISARCERVSTKEIFMAVACSYSDGGCVSFPVGFSALPANA